MSNAKQRPPLRPSRDARGAAIMSQQKGRSPPPATMSEEQFFNLLWTSGVADSLTRHLERILDDASEAEDVRNEVLLDLLLKYRDKSTGVCPDFGRFWSLRLK